MASNYYPDSNYLSEYLFQPYNICTVGMCLYISSIHFM